MCCSLFPLEVSSLFVGNWTSSGSTHRHWLGHAINWFCEWMLETCILFRLACFDTRGSWMRRNSERRQDRIAIGGMALFLLSIDKIGVASGRIRVWIAMDKTYCLTCYLRLCRRLDTIMTWFRPLSEITRFEVQNSLLRAINLYIYSMVYYQVGYIRIFSNLGRELTDVTPRHSSHVGVSTWLI